jgi:hypothetical protein
MDLQEVRDCSARVCPVSPPLAVSSLVHFFYMVIMGALAAPFMNIAGEATPDSSSSLQLLSSRVQAGLLSGLRR